MRSLFIVSILLSSILPLSSQEQVLIDYIKNPLKPIVFEDLDHNRIFLLFLPENISRNKNKQYQIVEMSADSLVVKRNAWGDFCKDYDGFTTSIQTHSSSWGDGKGTVAVSVGKTLFPFQFDMERLNLTQLDSLEISWKAHVLGGFSTKNEALVLSVGRKQKRPYIDIHKIESSGKTIKHRFWFPNDDADNDNTSIVFTQKIPRKKNDLIKEIKKFYFDIGTRIYEKDIEVGFMQPNMETFPEESVKPIKFYYDQGRVWMTYDIKREKTDPFKSLYNLLFVEEVVSDFKPNNYVHIFEFKTNVDSAKISIVPYTEQVTNNTDTDTDGSSYIMDGKLFQVSVNDQLFSIVARDMQTGKPLLEKYIKEIDTLDFANSPISFTSLFGEKGESINETFPTTRKFLKKMKSHNTFLSVKKHQSDYLMSIGGHTIKQSAGGYSSTGGIGGGPYIAGGYSYVSNFGFYTAFNKDSWKHSDIWFQHSVQDIFTEVRDKVSQNLSGVEDTGLFCINNLYYMGYFKKRAQTYTFSKLTNR